MVIGTLLICDRCGDCVEQLGDAPSRDYIESHRDSYGCDCGGRLELAPPEPRTVISHLEHRGG
jgi:hypothetical protein